MAADARDQASARSLILASGWVVWGLPAVALATLILVELGGLDPSLFRFFNRLSDSTGPVFWANVTILGDGLVCAVLLLPWVRRHPERIWSGLLGALFMVLVLRLFKGTLSLPRPLAVLPEEAVRVIGPGHRRSAFPSGHTATIALYAGVWALTSRQAMAAWGCMALAVLVGISRMVVGVHWPSDVLAGLALGWIAAWLGLRVASRHPWGSRDPGRRVLAGGLLISAAVLLVIDHTGYPHVLLLQRGLAAGCLAWGAWGFRNP